MKIRVLTLLTINLWITTITFGQTEKKLVIGANDIWAISPSSDNFYGLFIKQKLHDDHFQYEYKKINLSEYLPKPESPNHDKIKNDKLIFVFKGFESFKTTIEGYEPKLGYLYPGQSFIFGIGDMMYHLYANGQVIKTVDPKNFEVFNGIKDYEIGIKSTDGKNISEQTIIKRDILERWVVGDYLGGIKIDWIGDLNGDGKLDIIITNVGHHECFDIIIYSADTNDKFSEIHKNTICGG